MNNETLQSEILALREALERVQKDIDHCRPGSPNHIESNLYTVMLDIDKALTATAEAGKQARESVLAEERKRIEGALRAKRLTTPINHTLRHADMVLFGDVLEALKGGG